MKTVPGLFLAALLAANIPGLALELAFDEHGLSSLREDGVEFLQDGTFQLVNATLQSLDGTTSTISASQTTTAVDSQLRVTTVTAPEFTVTCKCEPQPDRVNYTIDVTNTSAKILRGICLQIAELKFPKPPSDWKPLYPRLGHNLGSPTIDVADVGDATLGVCNEDLGRPLIVGFPGGLSLSKRPVWISSANIGWLSPYLDPLIERPIFPGGIDRYRVSIRVQKGSVTAEKMGSDLLGKFRAAYPRELRWKDRRPVGALFLGRHESVSRANPRAWFDDPKADFSGADGRAKFQQALLRYADESVRVLKTMHAQGMIVWDSEGEEFTHPVTYLGDPRSLPPEMEPVADAFFKKFTEAGLRTGVCLRPQRAVRAAYGGEAFQIELADPEKALTEKIAYAKRRWGCTLFYIDSNGDPNVPLDASIFRRVAAAHPDVLLMPEHKNALYYAYTAPFLSFFHHGITSTPAEVRAIYPNAFGVIYAPEGPIEEHRAELTEAVRRGDILIFHGWYDDPHNALIKRIYEDAAQR